MKSFEKSNAGEIYLKDLLPLSIGADLSRAAR
jgi:hypothetical protein